MLNCIRAIQSDTACDAQRVGQHFCGFELGPSGFALATGGMWKTNASNAAARVVDVSIISSVCELQILFVVLGKTLRGRRRFDAPRALYNNSQPLAWVHRSAGAVLVLRRLLLLQSCARGP